MFEQKWILELRQGAVDAPGMRGIKAAELQLREGEMHALLGDRGTGKSALAEALAGQRPLRRGKILWQGRPVHFSNGRQASRLGMALLPQGSSLAPSLTVLDNVMLGAEKRTLIFLNRFSARRQADALNSAYQLGLDLRAKAGQLKPENRWKVELLKALFRKPRLLIVDEPAELLPPQESEQLLGLLRRFTKEGGTVLLITHRIHEALKADVCTVLRDGRTRVFETPEEDVLRRAMEGSLRRPLKKGIAPGSVVLEARNVTVKRTKTRRAAVRRVSFEVRAGEIVALAGLEGSGQEELTAAIAGVEKLYSGRFRLHGADITRFSVRSRAMAGIGLLPSPEDSVGQAARTTLLEHLIYRRQREKNFQDSGVIKKKEAEDYACHLLDQYGFDEDLGPDTPLRSLTVEETQLSAAAREADRCPDLLLAVQPARGLERSWAEDVYAALLSVRERRRAVLLVSRDVDEIMRFADRILVMYGGEIVGEFDPRLTTAAEIGLHMKGLLRQEKYGGSLDEEE